MGRYSGTFPALNFYEAFWPWDSAIQGIALAQWDFPPAKDNIRADAAWPGCRRRHWYLYA